MITHQLVVSCTTFSPLPHQNKAVILFYLYLLLPIASTFGSRASCAARTFLSHIKCASGRAGVLSFDVQSYK